MFWDKEGRNSLQYLVSVWSVDNLVRLWSSAFLVIQDYKQLGQVFFSCKYIWWPLFYSSITSLTVPNEIPIKEIYIACLYQPCTPPHTPTHHLQGSSYMYNHRDEWVWKDQKLMPCVFFNYSLTVPGVHWFSQTVWPTSARNLPVSTSSTLWWKMSNCAHLYMGTRDRK